MTTILKVLAISYRHNRCKAMPQTNQNFFFLMPSFTYQSPPSGGERSRILFFSISS